MTLWFYSILAQHGWRSKALLCALGALGALAMAPFYFWPALLLSLSGWFLVLVQSTTLRQAFWRGWWWGLGFFVAGLYWICIALTIDVVRFGWMIPFALLGLNGVLALFCGAASWLWFRLKRNGLTANWLLFAMIATGFEWLRGHLFTGFPWNLMGYSWGASDASAQGAALMGIYGLSLLTYAAAAAPSLLLLRAPRAGLAVAVVWLMVAGLCGWGALRVQNTPIEPSTVWVRLVQANIPQRFKWDQDHIMRSLQKHLDLSRSFGQERIDAIIWPETAFPFTLNEGSQWPSELSKIIAPHQQLITGAITQEASRLYNSMVAIDSEGEARVVHNKHHLVPFGEYLPYRRHLPLSIGKLTAGTTDFSFGEAVTDAVSLTDDVWVKPLICYEVIFPSYSAVKTRKGFLLNITNDGWYGTSTGPYQHREMMRFRAIEQGMPAMRVANTGISVAYDPLGRSLGEMVLEEEGVLDIQLPKPLEQNTPYGRLISQ